MTKIILLENANIEGGGAEIEVPPCTMEIACKGQFHNAKVSFEVQYQDNNNQFSGDFFPYIKENAEKIYQKGTGSFITMEFSVNVKLRAVIENRHDLTNISCFGFYQLRPNKNLKNY